MAEHKPRVIRKKIDTTQVTRYLAKVFANATEHLGRTAVKGSELYDLQVEFSYYIDDITRGPVYHVSKVIADCNQFIDDIVTSKR